MDDYGVFEEFDEAAAEAFFADFADEDEDSGGENQDNDVEASATEASSSNGTPATAASTGNTTSTAASSKRQQRQAGQSASNRRNVKKKIPRPKSTYTLAKAEAEQQSLLQESVAAVCCDKFVNEDSFVHAPPVKAYAERCRAVLAIHMAAQVMVQFCVLLQLIWPVIDGMKTKSTSTARQEFCSSEFFQLRNKSECIECISDLFFLVTETTPPHMFVQIYGQRLYDILVKKHEAIAPAIMEKVASAMSTKELNALRYVTGYIVSRLPRKILHKQEQDAMRKVLKNMTKDHDKDTALSFTRTWVEGISRGGLCLVNDRTFLLFRCLEDIVKVKFPETTVALRDHDIRQGILETVLVNQKILDKWTLLTAHTSISEHASLILLQILVDFYVQVRGFSFARNITEKYKIHQKSQENKSKSLRKEMKRSGVGEESSL